ncbi:MAG: F0F1 ATP synthase subunit epsilon [Synechococcaceae bacterium WBA_2_066]|nr:F0F1 ATP synthase subunit epsilon [Synechococcaceae bacterium WB6_1A_059]NBP99459.1 F0F1 ATP synthase subunit epsilon [Synechococcaceae bacterium WB6_3A_227]NBQ19191.1 F0F1 ATP synthase subunit epsilon [Synechococcaceae bacterium WB5_2A_257]NBR44191.1 F0F1 ATP synthase subunit epsilon [Synechococcaceae bacterium WB5_2B_268]NBY59034.1 F0F1 ATP synthase subunit epsilon [Synechococcaceae bacterium LLD_019]NCU77302.1 F0F1 ATP synthase subunit epsilon [Synechococcaceae bacterium WB7_1C_051]NCY1
MPLTLRVLCPDQSVFDGSADEVILPSTTGQLGVLPGHISLLTALEVGVLRLREGSRWTSIALMGGFAEVEADEVNVLVNGAEPASSINASTVQQELEAAQLAAASFEGKPNSPEKLKANQAFQIAKARLQATK